MLLIITKRQKISLLFECRIERRMARCSIYLNLLFKYFLNKVEDYFQPPKQTVRNIITCITVQKKRLLFWEYFLQLFFMISIFYVTCFKRKIIDLLILLFALFFYSVAAQFPNINRRFDFFSMEASRRAEGIVCSRGLNGGRRLATSRWKHSRRNLICAPVNEF